MASITATEARTNLHRLIDEVAASHQSQLIYGERNSAVLMSQEDWAAIQETLFLLSVPFLECANPFGMLSLLHI